MIVLIKLIIFDLDNVLMNGEAIDELGKIANVENQIAEITDKAMKGEIDFETSIQERVKLLEGVSVDDIVELRDKIPLTNGAEETIKSFPGRGERVAGAPTRAADLGCLRAAREPLRIRIRLPGHPTTGSPVSIWGSFGLPQAIPGLARTPARAPAPAPPPASQAITHAQVRTHAQIDVPKRGIYLVHLYRGCIYAWESDC